MFDWIKKVLSYEPKLRKDTPDINLPKEEVKEKTKEEVLAENIYEKYYLCKTEKLLEKAFKISIYRNDLYNTSRIKFRDKNICVHARAGIKLAEEYEYGETFYKYLCKAVDTINTHVEKKELRRKTKELECMKKFIGDSIYENPQAFNI